MRFFDIEKIFVKKHFIEFEQINDTSGEGIYESIWNIPKNCKLELRGCRCQRYDNGENMKAKINKDVQARILG